MNDPVRERLHKMGLLGQEDSGVARILRFLKERRGKWYASGELNVAFGQGDGQNPHFVGFSWRRRIHELAEEGLIERQRIAQGPHKGQNEWRIA